MREEHTAPSAAAAASGRIRVSGNARAVINFTWVCLRTAPHTLQTKHNLACLLVETEGFAGAQPLFEEVAAGRTAQLGPTHPDTQLSMHILAKIR